MGILDNMMKGYSDRVLGPEVADPQIAANQLSAAYQKIQDTLKTNRDTQRNSHALDTNPDKGEYQEVSAIQRWRNQIDAMITSGNPQLQKEGMAQLQAYQQKNTTAPAKDKPTTGIQEYQFAVNQGFDGTLQDWKKANKSSGVTIHTGDEASKKGTRLSEADLAEWGLSPGSVYVHTDTGPKPVSDAASDESTSQNNSLNLVTSNMNDMLFGEGGIYSDDEFAQDSGIPGLLKRTIKGNYERWAKDDSRFAEYEDLAGGMISNIARTIGGEKGPLSDGDMLRVKGLIPSLSGVNVDTEKTAAKKMKILEQLMQVRAEKGVVDKASLDAIMASSGLEEKKKTKIPKKIDATLPPLPEGFTWDD